MSSRSFSVGTFVQYAVLAVVGYILAGAPLLSIFSPSESNKSRSRANYRAPEVSQEMLETLVIPNRNLTCGDEHRFKGVHVLSREPLVVYIEGFLSAEEAEHVVEVRYVRVTCTTTALISPVPWSVIYFAHSCLSRTSSYHV